MTSARRPAVIVPVALRPPPGISRSAVLRPAMDDAAATASLRRSGQVRCFTVARSEELIGRQATAARIACEHMTAPALEMLRDSLDHASSLPTRPGWARKAAAYAEIFRLLGEIAGDRAGTPDDGAGALRDLVRTVGPAANGMIISSLRRLLAHLCAEDADAAEREMETHLRVLCHMGRLARPLPGSVRARDDAPVMRISS